MVLSTLEAPDMNWILRSLCCLAAMAVLTPAQTLQLPSRKVLTLEAVKAILAGAEAHANANKWTVTISVTDAGGHLLALHRLDGSAASAIELSQRKARTAAIYKRPSKYYQESLQSGRQALLAFPDVVASEGGVPIVVDGEIIGAVGVSGVLPNQDGEIAQAGIDALMKRLQ
jgi:uncharacterized protein GlcG (DUF336 family)